MKWCRLRDSNSRPLAYEATALPTELSRHADNYIRSFFWKQVQLQKVRHPLFLKPILYKQVPGPSVLWTKN